jgi:hypothetical protein
VDSFAMGQTESRNSTGSSSSRGSRVYYESGDNRYIEAPRYEVKKDTYEFWNTVDKKVPNALGSRISDYEVSRPSSSSYTYRQYEPTYYESRPISTTVVQEPYYYPTVQPILTQQSYSTAIPIVQAPGAPGPYTSYRPYTVSNPTYTAGPYVAAQAW